ncbi:1,4-dihydroxy-6-naphthoate synthase [Flavihumibacter petaseus]|uniref:1,4-dihydroxy-6-naphtoate synthase n=1 Tax=Flavihumibacter petaseus NBRC 106054 TaxID=1220578 RepID=A0A0E9N6W9_9BACT|nr:1,4-dihydroxy-6-naphthoate synthase [Flavihumibacter petaseus]GAO45574.1 hypothetical protein FPE01S_06_00650 [Flavihumibacter petaseus NBRC 106054]
MEISLGFSPCPNDTFIFDALVNGRIDPGPFRFHLHLEDVQTLNEWALSGKLDATKISYGVWPLLEDRYRLLEPGGALGAGVGPLLISREPVSTDNISGLRIGIPGRNTTAHLLFSLAFPDAKNKTFLVFHEIEDAVLSGQVDAGVIIHENRFTYADKGLHKVVDLGEYWESHLHCPIPLGGIVVRKNMDDRLAHLLEEKIRESIRYAWHNYPDLTEFVQQHSQEMALSVMRQHIQLYVNDYSLYWGEKGKKAINQLQETWHQLNAG